MRSPYLLGASIYSLGVDGLHALLNVPSHIAKWYFIVAFDSYHDPGPGPWDPGSILDDTRIMKHISKCIKLKCWFPKDNKEAGKINLFGQNIKRLTNTWAALRLLVVCDDCECGYDPWQF